MICLKSNSKLSCSQLYMSFRISLIEGSGTDTNTHLHKGNDLVGSTEGHMTIAFIGQYRWFLPSPQGLLVKIT